MFEQRKLGFICIMDNKIGIEMICNGNSDILNMKYHSASSFVLFVPERKTLSIRFNSC